MKKHSLILTKIAVAITIFFGVLLILFANEKSFKKIVADDIENISKLSSSIIYSEIDNSLTKPIFVGLTMANDRFLKDWLSNESQSGCNDKQLYGIQQYLMDYKNKYNYNSMSIISSKSNIYYYQDGINKIISPDDNHDVWYYDFINSGKDYDLDVDMDEVNDKQLTVFVNSKINDDNGNLMGVAAVGIKMVNLQALLRQYEEKYDLRAFLINEQGLIQVDSIDENIENLNFFNSPKTSELKNQIIQNKTDMQTFWYPDENADHCLITKYVDNLDWYIVIEKNTYHTQQIFAKQINHDLLWIGIIITLVLVLISCMIGKYNRMLLKTASMDDVTGLPNAKMFQEIFNQNLKRRGYMDGVLFMFDIDRFKDVNDRFGHLFGNFVLYRISEIATKEIGNNGVISRWGGDEFVGVIYRTQSEANDIMCKIVNDVSDLYKDELKGTTISLGATNISGKNNLDLMIREADSAMYRSKANGRNKVTFF